MKKFLAGLATAVGVAICVGGIAALIFFGPDIHQFFGTRYADADREIFKGTVTYNEGMLDDLAEYKYEYDKAADEVEKAAIASLVRSRFANFDQSRIENRDLLKFLEECGL